MKKIDHMFPTMQTHALTHKEIVTINVRVYGIEMSREQSF